MGRLVEVDDDLFEWAQQKAEPLVDTFSSVVKRELGWDGPGPSRQSLASASPSRQLAIGRGRKPKGSRPLLNEYVLGQLGVNHFVVDGKRAEWRGKTAHPRAYLDAKIQPGRTDIRYFERWKEEGRPNPRGDAAARVVLKVGADDHTSIVHFRDARQMTMAEFVRAFLEGTL